MTTSKVGTTTIDDVRILTLRGEFMGGEGTDELREALAKETQEGCGGLLIDLTEATYLDSTALGVLIGAHTSFSKRGAAIGLCGLSGNVEKIFVITKLALVLAIYPTREDGVREMARGVTRPLSEGYINRAL